MNCIIIFLILLLIPSSFIFYLHYKNPKDYEIPSKICPLQKSNTLNKKENLYIAVDFGNYKSGFAYNFGEDLNNIIEYSVPSEIILHKTNFTARNFGFKSFNSFLDYNDNEKKNIIYIQQLKSKLLQSGSKDLNFKSKIESILKSIFPFFYASQITGGIYPVDNYNDLDYFQVLKEYFIVFSDYILQKINSKPNNEKYNKNEVNWIISVPCYFSEFIKSKFLNSLKESGLFKINLVIEQEAAPLGLLIDRSMYEKLIQNNKNFLIIDLGDYSVDLSLYQIMNDVGEIKFKLKYPFVSETYGSMNINKNMSELLDYVFGKNYIAKIKQSQPEEYLQTMKIIEEIKIKFAGEETNIFEAYAKFERQKGKIGGNITIFNYTIEYNKNKIFIPAQVFKYYIEENKKKILNFIQDEINKFNKANTKVDYIVLSGGYSQCKILRKGIIDRFKKQNIDILIPDKADRLVMRGALIYIIKPYKIYSLISPYTILMEMHDLYNDSNEDKNGYINKNDDQNCYEKLINYGEKIKTNHIIQKKIKLSDKNQNYQFFNFYCIKKSYKETLKYNLKNLALLGKLIINLNKQSTEYNITDVLLNIQFNPYLKIFAFDLKSNSTINTTFILCSSGKIIKYYIIKYWIYSLFYNIFIN